MGRVGHADILGSHGGTLGQLLARYKFVIVVIAKVPQWLKLFVFDLIILLNKFEYVYLPIKKFLLPMIYNIQHIFRD